MVKTIQRISKRNFSLKINSEYAGEKFELITPLWVFPVRDNFFLVTDR